MFKLSDSYSANGGAAALYIVEFNSQKEVASTNFIDLGNRFKDNFAVSATTDGISDFARIIHVDELIADEKYYFVIQVSGFGDIIDQENHISEFITSTFKKGDWGNILEKNEDPTVQITSPSNNSSFERYESIRFICDASDKEDGVLADEQIRWFSDINGFFGTGNNFSTSELELGDHNIRVEVTDKAEAVAKDEVRLTITPSAGHPPTADFTANRTTIVEGETIKFYDLSLNDPTEWGWTFGDGGLSIDQNPEHTYMNSGVYTVSLQVINEYGFDKGEKVNYITVQSNGHGQETGTVEDIDGNVYNTVKIGDQWWMAENLKVTHFQDGASIPLIISDSEWGNLSSPGYCWYNNNDEFKNPYGAMYNWHTISSGKLCPSEWHVPSDDEWTVLTDYLGGQNVAGGKLKESGTMHWNSPNSGATNETGFTAVPGGYRHSDGFYYLGGGGGWWNSSQYSNTHGKTRSLNYDSEAVGIGAQIKFVGYSVRCVKD